MAAQTHIKVIVQEEALDPCQATEDYQTSDVATGKYGGVVTFVGTMRDFNDGHQVSEMYLDYYPGMTERHIEKVCEEAAEKWEVMNILVVHRHGAIRPSDPIVLVAVWSAHRANAFDACRFVINYLKERAPFWKRETTPQGQRWVEHNTKDPAAEAAANNTVGIRRTA
ncbi:MAG: molybdenum cofactor biosynthesis protein MoaE [Pseudomonadota bacterium]